MVNLDRNEISWISLRLWFMVSLLCIQFLTQIKVGGVEFCDIFFEVNGLRETLAFSLLLCFF